MVVEVEQVSEKRGEEKGRERLGRWSEWGA
jgi:hypothetical protein